MKTPIVIDARFEDPGATLAVCWLPVGAPAALDEALRGLGSGTPGVLLAQWLPDRLARAVCTLAGVDPGRSGPLSPLGERVG